MTFTETALIAALASIAGVYMGIRLARHASGFYEALANRRHIESAAYAHAAHLARLEAEAVMEAASALLAAYSTWASLHNHGDEADAFLAAEATALRDALASRLERIAAHSA